MTPDVHDTTVALIEQARRNGTKLGDMELAGLSPSTMADALDIASTLHGGPVTAWKLGGTNAATRAVFNVEGPYFGPLRADEVFESSATLNQADYPAPLLAEPEIAVAFERDFPAMAERRRLEDIANTIAWVAPSIELPASVLNHPPSAGVHWLVADRCAAGALVVGPKMPAGDLDTLEQADISIMMDGHHIRAEQNTLIGGVLGTLQDMLAVFGDHNIALPKGVIIATGGLAPARDVRGTHTMAAHFGPHSVAISFTNSVSA